MTSSSLFFLLSFLLFCSFYSLSNAEDVFENLDIHPTVRKLIAKHGYQAVEDSLCENLEKSFMNPLRCARGETLETLRQPGVDFAKKNNIESRAPILFFPGFGGSSLEAKLDKDKAKGLLCKKKRDWFRIWVAGAQILTQGCWFDNLSVKFDEATSTYSNMEGVEIRPIDFGGFDGIRKLITFFGLPVPLTDAYSSLIESFEAAGYVTGKDLIGVPYDFRVPPDDNAKTGVYDRIKQLIEDTYTNNGNTPVHLVTHSMGGPTALFFLNGETQEWKDQYIASFIPIAGPWSGASRALKAAVYGEDFGLKILGKSILSLEKVRNFARESGGLISLFPDTIFYQEAFTFVQTPTKNYTASDFKQLFTDLGTPITATIHTLEENLFNDMAAPMVPTHCLYGFGVETEIAYHFPEGLDSDKIIVDYTNLGDGTVPLESLQECASWMKEQQQPLDIVEYDLKGHIDIVKDPELIEYILSVTTTSSPA